MKLYFHLKQSYTFMTIRDIFQQDPSVSVLPPFRVERPDGNSRHLILFFYYFIVFPKFKVVFHENTSTIKCNTSLETSVKP